MRKLAKNEKVCQNCNRIFRKKKNQRNVKYCPDCRDEVKRRKQNHRNSLGTPLSRSSPKKQLNHIRYSNDYFEKDGKHMTESKREFVSETYAYFLDDDQNCFTHIGYVYDNDGREYKG